jgi:hypothetical protein
VPVVVEDKEESEISPCANEVALSSPGLVKVRFEKGNDGTNETEERENEENFLQKETVGECGVHRGVASQVDGAVDNHIDVAGILNPVQEPSHLGLPSLGLENSDPPFLGVLVNENFCRCSTMSEPEDLHSFQKSKLTKSKCRRHKHNSKFPTLGVPKCVQLVEAMKEAAPKQRKRRHKGGVALSNGAEAVVEEAEQVVVVLSEGRTVLGGDTGPIAMNNFSTPTPTSGLNLLSGSDISRVPESQPQGQDVEKEKLIEAAKLLSIQKEVGFNFDVSDDEILKNLVEQEKSDREKKMDWEKRDGDQ